METVAIEFALYIVALISGIAGFFLGALFVYLWDRRERN